MPLYHKDVFLPKLKLPNGCFTLHYTNHAKQACLNDKRGFLPIINSIDTSKCQLIEVETDDHSGKLIKLVYRMPLDKKRDITLAIAVRDMRKWAVKTVWSESPNDHHSTLNVSRYHRC